jgi:glutathione synthase/RimK-type ligase-like ATP-grasp enzyme
MMKFPKVLLISNRFDFSTDFIAVELANQGIDFIRINRDELKDYTIDFDPVKPEIIATYNDYSFTISTEYLKSIYYRAPTFLRDIFQEGLSEEEQLIRTQWAAFVRSLCVFENAKWLNNPTDIYKAEIKPYQLFIANKLGIRIPKTTISNVTLKSDFEFQAIKSIDTAIVSSGENEGFVYTEIYKKNELEEVKYSSPFFIQQGLVPKTDIRVTVVENDLVAIKITGDKKIDEDWRRFKDELTYSIFELPKEVHDFCINYTKKLNLNFGAIDLVLHNNDYYFIEINPTGEWSWLQKNTGYNFDKLIVKSLTNE